MRLGHEVLRTGRNMRGAGVRHAKDTGSAHRLALPQLSVPWGRVQGARQMR